ncbi:geranylgeranylglyceryl/heptaprenylglyceryl phosphate synthase [Candidatus Bathyarchaeota archaeon]|nr:geranylgeranylglyceryl/heptaprenylglyceryl phosphate synthase [Candidatus Bathyarchaeota archaeon]
MVGKVEKHIENAISRDGAIHLSLIDPENVTPERAGEIAYKLQKLGSSAIMVGGSTVVSPHELDEVVKGIKKRVAIPIILFPNGVAGISQYADAIFFSTLMNSMNPYYITGAQALGAPLVKRYGLEVLPMGYIIVGSTSGAAGFVGQAVPLPLDKPELASMYALAAQYLGMRFVYLEAGSGSMRPVPSEMISSVRKSVDVKLIVGGGIRTPEQASDAVKAGADAIVTGTVIENSTIENAERLIRSIRKKY